MRVTIVGGDSFRYYPGSAGSALDDLQRNESQATVADEHCTQLLCVRRLHGGLTIGDTAEYDEPLAFDVGEAPYAYLADIVEEFLGPSPPGRCLQPMRRPRHSWCAGPRRTRAYG